MRMKCKLDFMVQDSPKGGLARLRYAHEARRRLEILAKDLRLPRGEYSIRFTGKDGEAGQALLHAEFLFVKVCANPLGDGAIVNYRACNGLKDHAGGRNFIVPAARLYDRSAMIDNIRLSGFERWLSPDYRAVMEACEPLRGFA